MLRSGISATNLAKLLALLRNEMGHKDIFTKRNKIFEGYLALRARVQNIHAPQPTSSAGSISADVSIPVELTAKDIMSEAISLLQQLSDYVEEEKAVESAREGKQSTAPLVTLQHVTTLDMGSYLLSIVIRGEEMQAREKLNEIDRQLAQDRTLSAAKRDHVFGEHVQECTRKTVSFLSSLPSNCVEESSKREA